MTESYASGTSDEHFPDRDWTDLAVLVGIDTPLGRAVRHAQRFFSDAELSAAIAGRSKTVVLTVVDDEIVFLNAAMVADVISDYVIQPQGDLA